MPTQLLALLFVVTSVWTPLSRAAAAGDSHRTVILITIDGFPAYSLDDPRAPIPTLRELAKRGTVSVGMRVVNPAVTWPNHTALVTGVRPAKHSVLFNGILTRRGPQDPVRVDPAHDQADLVAVPTVFDLLHKAGLTTAGINWPCTRNSPSLDVNFPDVPEQVKYMTPSLRDEIEAAGVLPAGGDATFIKVLGGPGRDQVWTQVACRVIAERKPNFMLFHLLNVDAEHHKYGPQTPAGYSALALADAQIRELLRAIDAAGIKEQTTLFVVADHGFKSAAKALLPNVLFRSAGLLMAGPTGILKARAQAISEGGTALIYLNDPQTASEDRAKVLELLRGKEGIAAVIEPADFAALGMPTSQTNPQAPDLIVAAKDGYAFDGLVAGEEFVVPVVPNRHMIGNHGYLSDDPKMNALFIAAGKGIEVGKRIPSVDNVDVAPTIAHLFGQTMPNTDGKVLASILTEK